MVRGLGTNAQVTTPGGLRFQRGPFGVGFSPGVRRGYPHDMTEPHWPRALAMAEPRYDVAWPRHPATPHHTLLKLTFGLGCPILYVSHHTSNPCPTIPHGLTLELDFGRFSSRLTLTLVV
ncbi:hypothetical protein Hanom_Chr14g01332921 [Helianthus anomalus]